MFDVLPPTGRAARDEPDKRSISRRRARPLRASVSSTRPQPIIKAGPRTVQVEWKLPARLRKPIREQLIKERKLRARRKAIISFERRPIHTRALLVGRREEVADRGGITLPRRRIFNRGAEHHTGDTYQHSRPQLQVAAPPYLGRFGASARPAAHRVPRATPSRRPAPQPRQPVNTARPRLDVAARPRRRLDYVAPAWQSGERDVAYNWNDNQPDIRPHRLSVPFSFNLWPRFLWGERQDESINRPSGTPLPSSPKKKVQSGRIIDLSHIGDDARRS